MRGSHRRTVATVTTLMIVIGMTALAAPASGAPVPDHIVLSPDPATITVGTTQTYVAEGFDASNGDLGDVTVDTAFTIDGTGTCSLADCGSADAGDYTVTGTDGTAIATAMLQVNGPLDHITLAPASTTIAAGTTQAYTATGFDSLNDSLGDVTSSTTFTIDPPGSCAGANCGSAVPGDYTVKGAVSGSIMNSATLHVVAPSIVSFSPSSGRVHAVVVIRGSDLTAASVQFHGTPAASVTVNSDTRITAAVPMGATTGRISITTPDGSTSSLDRFKVKPTISRFKKTRGRTGTRVVIIGSAFTRTALVTFNRTRARFRVASYKRIIAIVPLRATSGRIRVRTPSGGASSALGFKVKPRITQFTPREGRVGTSVVITGSGFSKVWRVAINGRDASFQVVSSLKIVAKVPRAKSGPIRVRTAFGGVESPTPFRVV